MKEVFTLAEIDQAVEAVSSRTSHQPKVGLILGSGLGELANLVEEADFISYNDVPFMPVSTVRGHQGRFALGRIGGTTVIVQQGRSHFYEGYSMAEVTLPVRIMQRLGVDTLIVTNAAGAINPDFEPGDVMLITDHISLVAMTGFNPLRGPNLEDLGTRFPDMSQAYNRKLMDLVRQEARNNNIPLKEGVYIALAGPSFETPADLRFLRAVGADAVGMSTVPEVIVARHANMHVLGISGISNKANLDGSTVTTHEEVLEAGRVVVPKLKTLILGVLSRL